jgi:hypothetical protein
MHESSVKMPRFRNLTPMSGVDDCQLFDINIHADHQREVNNHHHAAVLRAKLFRAAGTCYRAAGPG